MFHITLNSPLSTVACGNIILAMTITHITVINVVFAGKNLVVYYFIEQRVANDWERFTTMMHIY